MNILMIVRSTSYTAPGGDTMQVEKTAKYLRELGLRVDIRLADADVDHTAYDIVHFFNIIRPDDILPHINHTVPFVVSTVFVDYSEYEKKNRKGILGILSRWFKPGKIEYLKAVARWLINGDKIKSGRYLWKGHDHSIRYILSRAAMLLPNSDSEYRRLSHYFPNNTPYRKIVNAVDAAVFNEQVIPDERFKDHILCVGRIEGLKNQLNLVKAFAGSPVPVTFIGKSSPNHLKYFRECREAATANVHFVEHIDHHELAAAYKAARVHVLPSWFETTGLSSLEAAVMGCNIVVTDKGDTKEYFGDKAFYCEPDDVDSIRNAVMEAYNKPVDPSLRAYMLEHYTWQQTAAQTYAAYQEVLKNNISHS